MLGDPAGLLLKILTPAAIVAAGVGSLVLFGRKPEPAAPPQVADRGALVETAAVERFDDAFKLKLDGVALPVRRIKLAAEVEGRITAKSDAARGGRRVAPDMPLFEIDPTDYQLEVERLRAQSEQADEQLAAVDVDIANTEELLTLAIEDQALARRTLERSIDLNSRNAISETELDEAKRHELTSRNALQSLRNQLSTQQQQRRTQQAACNLVAVQLKQAQTNLARTRIVSPINGSVITDHVEVDDHVRPGDVLIELSDNSQMEIRCSLTIEHLFWIWLAGAATGKQSAAIKIEQPGGEPQPDSTGPLLLPDASSSSQPSAKARPRVNEAPTTANLELPRLPVFVVYEFGGQRVEWDGVLSRYEGSGLDAQTRTAPCRILVPEPTKARVRAQTDSTNATAVVPPRMFSGMYVDIEIPIATRVPLLKLPLEAIRPGDSVRSGRKVWVDRQGRLAVIDVKVARVEADHALVHEHPTELSAGDRVIVSPLASVSEGMAIRERDSDPFAEAANTETRPAADPQSEDGRP
jgi:multidrug efflux pump subunit AcrA (membrane-fusion protein)